MDVDAHSDEKALIKYKMQLTNERDSLDPCYELASKLLLKEIERIERGGTEAEQSSSTQQEKRAFEIVSIHDDRPYKMHVNLKIPTTPPGYNFIGKLLGPKGATLKQLQMETMTKMAIMGRGSMRDKEKEDECRKEGGKFSHLNEELHIRIEAHATPLEAYSRLSTAMGEVQKFLIPEYGDESMMYGAPQNGMLGGPMGRGGPRGGPGGLLTSPRGGGRGGGMSRGAGVRGGRGTPRGAMPSRGPGNRGGIGGRGPGMNRGSAPTRGGASRGMVSHGGADNRSQNMSEQSYQEYSGYDSYQGQSYEESYEDNSRNEYTESSRGGYGDGMYGQQASTDNSYNTRQSRDEGYYDYGHGGDMSEGYNQSFGDRSWDSGASKSMPASRGSQKSYRGSHPARPY